MTMTVYTVHAPTANGTGLGAADKFVFVRDGFHFWAMIFGPLWLIWNRLWLATLGWIIVGIPPALLLARRGVGGAEILGANVLVAILRGRDAASLQRWTLSRSNWRQLDTVVGDDEETAERRFFDRWTAGKRGSTFDSLTVERGGPPPTRDIPGQPFS